MASNRMEKVAFLQDNNKLQDSLKLCEEQEKSTDLETERFMRDIERLEIKKVQLEASLRRQQEQEKEIKQLMEERKAAHLQNITELQSFLEFCEEQSRSTELEGEHDERHRATGGK